MLWLFLSAFCSAWLLCCFKRRTSFENSVVGLLFKHTSPNLGSYPHTLHFVYSSPSNVLFYVYKLITILHKNAGCVSFWEISFFHTLCYH